MATAASSKKLKAMPKKNLVHFEKRLLEERKRVLKELGHYDETFGSTPQGADGDLSAYSFHMARALTQWSVKKRFCSRARRAGSCGTLTKPFAVFIAIPNSSANATTAGAR